MWCVVLQIDITMSKTVLTQLPMLTLLKQSWLWIFLLERYEAKQTKLARAGDKSVAKALDYCQTKDALSQPFLAKILVMKQQKWQEFMSTHH